jgi:integrase
MGAVRVETVENRVRLRWTYGGRRFCLSIGSNTQVVQQAARHKAAKIERDILYDEFDASLVKYKQEQLTSALDIWDAYAKFKQDKVCKVTLANYTSTRRRLVRWRGRLVSNSDAEKFIQAQDDIKPITVNKYLGYLTAAWELAKGRGLVKENLWKDVVVKVPPKQKPKPFTEAEARSIIAWFRASQHYSHYADFVVFRFGTGLRFGEAAGLRWSAVSDDCSRIWVGEIMTRGVRRPTKTNRDRTVPLTKGLQSLLLSRRPSHYEPDSLVFPSPEGGAIDSANFRHRAWLRVLSELDIPYRKPYTTRSSFISWALARGVNPVNLAAITGHDTKVMFEHYAGVVGEVTLPDVLAGS